MFFPDFFLCVLLLLWLDKGPNWPLSTAEERVSDPNATACRILLETRRSLTGTGTFILWTDMLYTNKDDGLERRIDSPI
jgi:hypothetical protein